MLLIQSCSELNHVIGLMHLVGIAFMRQQKVTAVKEYYYPGNTEPGQCFRRLQLWSEPVWTMQQEQHIIYMMQYDVTWVRRDFVTGEPGYDGPPESQ